MTILEDPLVVLEGLLLTSDQPLSLAQLRVCFDKRYSKPEIARLLVLLKERWEGRALELKEVGDGLWRFQSVAEVRDILRKLHPEEAPKYTRTVMETLAVIAYRQPVTRGDIEKIRGVTVNPQAIRTLLDRNWIEVIGRRETIGHPELFATTRQFLLDLGLNSLQDLPSLSETAPEEAEAFELFEGQYDREEELRQHRLLDSPLLAAIDAEHARLESLAKAVPSETK
ncbi:MAG: SMC-Scp complex subunit ScpB [Burkholderiaceae bacterium]|nr:SMC-Scp complex subunit ScpB [Burkholderiaceae bacterium]